jgi:general secretion pathway protein M
MSARAQALWLARTPRERWLLGVMFALAALVLAWFLVLRPLGDMLSAARERHGEAVAALAETRSQAAEIAMLERGGPAAIEGPIDQAVAAAASEAGFQLSALQAQGPGRVSFALGAARPEALFGWIQGLEGQGYVVERLSASSNPDRTLSAQIVLRIRGR